MTSASDALQKQRFQNALPPSRLGKAHKTLLGFQKASAHTASRQKEYSLVVVTEHPRRILLGMKHRGFGKGMYNSFGGKIESGESVVDSACRELEEETGILVSSNVMGENKVGVMHFTFVDSEVEMVVHVYHIQISTNSDKQKGLRIDPSVIRGCDEITPEWFEDYLEMPLDNMFADDSIWLTHVLACRESIDGWFHFKPGGQDANSILHHFLKVTKAGKHKEIKPSPAKPSSLERRLFSALHEKTINSPSLKEFNEAYAFSNAVRRDVRKNQVDIVIDVAGGHGALAAIFLVTTSAFSATVVDPAQVGNGSVQRAWGSFFGDKTLHYRHECLRTGLDAELKAALQVTSPDRILVVACHACQHLSDETVEISCRYGVHVAVMPCCQNDSKGNWKNTSKNINVPIAKLMDVLLAGKVMSWTCGQEAGVEYDVRMKVIDPKITPQNRVIVCRVQHSSGDDERRKRTEESHRKLQRAYQAAHRNAENHVPKGFRSFEKLILASLGFGLGALVSASFFRKR